MRDDSTETDFQKSLRVLFKIAKKEAKHTQGSSSKSSNTRTKQGQFNNYQKEGNSLDRERWRDARERWKDLKANRDLRNKYAKWVFIFMCIWCGLVFLIVILDSLTYTPPAEAYLVKDMSFHVSTSVLNTLIGGTTISVIGLVGFIIKGLFPSSNTDKQKNE